MSKKLIKYAFLDRDGTLIYEPTLNDIKSNEVPYQVDSLDKLKVLPGVIKGLQKISKAGYKLVIVSNQDGLGTKIYPINKYKQVNEEMKKLFANEDIVFENILVCPHFKKDNCLCRKPKTGLLDKFLEMNSVDKRLSFVCGDRKSDEMLAKRIGLRFLSIKTNKTFRININI